MYFKVLLILLFSLIIRLLWPLIKKQKNMENKSFKMNPNQRLVGIVAVVGSLLLIPLIAMQFTDEVNWDFFDFIVATVLLLGTGLVCELVLRTVRSTKNRILLCGIVLVILFLVWAELAVGLFGTPLAGS